MERQKNKKKKILFVITKSNFGGAQKYVYDLATNLPDFDVAVALGGKGLLKHKLESKNIRTIEIESLGRDIKVLDDIFAFFNLLSIFNNEKPDIIHLNSSKIGGIGSLAGRIARIKKIVFTVHGWAFEEDRSTLSKIAIKFISWLTILFSHYVIVLSQFQKKNSPTILMRKKIHVIHNGINITDILDKKIAYKKLQECENRIPDDSFLVGSVAELHKNKGLTYLIDAFSEIKKDNIFLILIGEGEEKKNLYEKIHSINLENKIFLLGNIQDAYKYLKAFDIFALTSVKEGLPYSLLEAGLAGIPVISSEVGGIPDLIDNKKTGLLSEPKNVAQIKANLMTLVENEELRKEYGDALNKKVKSHFSLERTLEELKEIYLKI